MNLVDIRNFSDDLRLPLLLPQHELALQIQNLKYEDLDPQQKTAFQNFVFILVYFITCLKLYFKAVEDARAEFVQACGSHDFPRAAALLKIKEIQIDAPRIQAYAPGAELPMQMTLLHDAISRRDYPLIEFLLDHGAKFDVEDEQGNPPFHYAFDREDKEETVRMVEFLLSKGLPIDSKDKDGQTLVHYAYGMGYTDLADSLLQRGAKIDAGVNLLHFLYDLGRRQELILKLMGEKNLDPDAKDAKDFSLLEKAYNLHDYAFALRLIDAGAEVNTPFKGVGKTFLHYVAGEDLQMQEELLKRGADPAQKDSMGRTALHIAAGHGAPECTMSILAKVPTLIHDKDLQGRTPLQCAAAAVHGQPTVNLLIAAGAAIDAPDDEGYTALHNAALMGRKDMVDHLLQNKANINAQNTYGETCLHLASNSPEIVEILLRHGAEKLPNKYGKLPDVTAVEQNMAMHQDVQELAESAQVIAGAVKSGLFSAFSFIRELALQGSQESSASS